MSQLLEKSKALRKAQVAYMEARQNDAPNKSALGKAVGEAAVELDIAIIMHEKEMKKPSGLPGFLRGAQIVLSGVVLGNLAHAIVFWDGKVMTLLPLLTFVALHSVVTGMRG